MGGHTVTGHPAYGTLRPVTAAAGVVLADNPSPMTLEGTNSWVLRAPGHPGCVVIDPGPDDPAHLDRLAAFGPVELVLLTHRHPDHTDGVPAFADRTGAPVRSVDPAFLREAEGLRPGERLAAAGLTIRVLGTPGHTWDSVCFVIGGDASVLTGDTVLGRGTTVLGGAQDGDDPLGDYLGSLASLAELPAATTVLPGHGPDLPDAAATAREYLAHREQRLDQVRSALADLGLDARSAEPRQVVEVVYADVDSELWPAADQSVAAQLAHLTGRP